MPDRLPLWIWACATLFLAVTTSVGGWIFISDLPARGSFINTIDRLSALIFVCWTFALIARQTYYHFIHKDKRDSDDEGIPRWLYIWLFCNAFFMTIIDAIVIYQNLFISEAGMSPANIVWLVMLLCLTVFAAREIKKSV